MFAQKPTLGIDPGALGRHRQVSRVKLGVTMTLLPSTGLLRWTYFVLTLEFIQYNFFS